MGRMKKNRKAVKNWAIWLDTINDMIASGEYYNASTFLNSVAKWVEDNQHITEKQISVIENLKTDVDEDIDDQMYIGYYEW
jgi:pterin-4a-carbinolamine dehydratase